MKIIFQDIKKGIVKVKIQTEDDCWHLYNILEEGDNISSITYRSKKDDNEKIRRKKEEKEKVFLKIEVKNKEFQEFTNRLRIRGKILDGVQDIGAHHTFNIELNMEITIEKIWKSYQIKRLKDSQKKHHKIAVINIDDDETTIAKLHEYGVEIIATLYSNRAGKMYKNDYDEGTYFKNILKATKQIRLPLAIVGPGFVKNRFINYAQKELDKYIVDSVTQSGVTGIYETIKRGIIEKIMKENRVNQEVLTVEDLLANIAQHKPIAYGINEVEKAVNLGAAEKVLILNSMINKLENIIQSAEDNNTPIEIISDSHEGGRKLLALGGIAAFLRYCITY